jgi:hypothetical protein
MALDLSSLFCLSNNLVGSVRYFSVPFTILHKFFVRYLHLNFYFLTVEIEIRIFF